MQELIGQEKIWAHFQNTDAQLFDAAQPRQDYLLNQIRRKCRAAPHILNIGIGNGYLETTARDLGWHVSTIDPDDSAVSRMRAAGVDARKGYAEAMPFETHSFEFVIASEVLEHIHNERRANAISEIARVLVPYGTFIGTVPYREELDQLKTVCPDCGSVFHRWGHHASFNEETLVQQLNSWFQVERAVPRAFVSLRGRSLLGKAKGAARLMLARTGAQIADPRLFFRARRRVAAI